MSIVLGIDAGTQSIKVVVYDADSGSSLASASTPLKLHQTDSGIAEQRAEWWLKGLGTALAQIAPQLRRQVSAIGVSGQQHGFVPLDATGAPLLAVKLWCDTSTTAECDWLTGQLGGPGACLAATGNLILPGYTASKVLWFRNAYPDLYARMHSILLPHDYLNFYLTGIRCMEAGDASGTGFFDIRRRQWSEPVLHAIDPNRDLREVLPEVAVEAGIAGSLRAPVAAELGLPNGIPVTRGGGDNMMAAIGTGNVLPGRVTMSLGTSGTIYSYADRPIVDDLGDETQGQIAAFCSSTGGWLPLLCTMNCTNATELARGLFAEDLNAFEQHLQASPRGARGVLTVPYFNGERTPNLPQGKACILGLDSQNMQPEHILRAAVEGVTLSLHAGLDRLAGLGIETEEIVLTGGGAKSPTWRQIVADVCNAPVTILQDSEAAALGAALQALAVTSGADLAELTRTHLRREPSLCCEPEAAAVGEYAELLETYDRAAAQVCALYG